MVQCRNAGAPNRPESRIPNSVRSTGPQDLLRKLSPGDKRWNRINTVFESIAGQTFRICGKKQVRKV